MAEEKKLYHLVDELETDALTLIKLARRSKMSYSPSEEQVEVLRRKISGYYDLSDTEIRSLEDFLGSDAAQDILRETSVLMEAFLDQNEEKKYLNHIATHLFNAIDDEGLKAKIKKETLYETIMNLGVVTLYRTASTDIEEDKLPPLELLRFDNDVARGVLKRYFIRKLESIPIRDYSDFNTATKIMQAEYQRMLVHLGGEQ